MARGDFVDITYRTGTGVAKERVMATSIGSKVEVELPRQNEPFLIVRERDKADVARRTAYFAKLEVMSMIEGHENGTGKPRKAKA